MVGSSLVSALLDRRASIVALVRDGSPQSQLVRGGLAARICVVRGDLTDLDRLRQTMAKYSIQTVFHLGAQTVVGVAKSDPLSTMESNIRGTWNILEAARLGGIAQLLIASSVLVAGTESISSPTTAGQQSTTPGLYPYEVSKICAERLAQTYAQTYRLPIGVVRCGNLYGGGDLNFSRLIPGAVRATLRGERFQFRSDGRLMRDFLYCEDVVGAYIRFAERIAADPSLAGVAIPFGSGRRHSVLDIVRTILRLADRGDLEPLVGSAPSTEIAEEALDLGDARNFLGWTPEYSLEEGLRCTIAWYRMHFEAGLSNAQTYARGRRTVFVGGGIQ